MEPKWKPAGYTSVSPYLITKNAEGVVAFLEATLEGRVLRRFDTPDRVHARALESGAESVQAPTHREGDPDRRGGVKGPGGNTWWFGTQLEG